MAARPPAGAGSLETLDESPQGVPPLVAVYATEFAMLAECSATALAARSRERDLEAAEFADELEEARVLAERERDDRDRS